MQINLENTEGEYKWTIQRNWQHRVHKTIKNKTKNTTQNVLDTTIETNTNNVNKT
jgi:hypothetical protein